MAYNQDLKDRVKKAIMHIPNVEEKQMFGGIAFMVNEKMCINIGEDRIMCRIDPEIHAEALNRKGCETVKMRGREYKGFVNINQDGLREKEDFDYWINLALDFNKRALISKKRKKK